MTTPAEIARGLTRAQAAFMHSLPADGQWKLTSEGDLNAYGKNALRGFGQTGLIEGYYRDPMKHRLTPLGKTVDCIRRVLEQEREGG